MSDNKLPLCPLLSAGSEIEKVCLQDRCAWYVKTVRACSAFIVAHSQLVISKGENS